MSSGRSAFRSAKATRTTQTHRKRKLTAHLLKKRIALHPKEVPEVRRFSLPPVGPDGIIPHPKVLGKPATKYNLDSTKTLKRKRCNKYNT